MSQFSPFSVTLAFIEPRIERIKALSFSPIEKRFSYSVVSLFENLEPHYLVITLMERRVYLATLYELARLSVFPGSGFKGQSYKEMSAWESDRWIKSHLKLKSGTLPLGRRGL